MALVQYTGRNVFGVGLKGGVLMRLLPGVNEVQDEVLNQAKAHPLFMARVNKGIVKILQDSVGKDGKRSVEDMLTYIPNIFDVKLLKKIMDNDGRSPVIQAAQYQYDTIKNPAKAKADKEDGDHFK